MEQTVNALIAAFVLALFPPAGPVPSQPTGAPLPPAPEPAVAATAQLPGVVMLDRVPGCYGAVRFDHAGHVKMTAISSDCRTCHHELPERADAVGPVAPRACRDCHDASSEITKQDRPSLRGAYHRQCLSCHKDWGHENACGFCHASSATALAPSMHVAQLPASRAATHPTYVYRTGHKVLPVVTFHHDDHSQRYGLQCAECHAGSTCGSCHGGNIERPPVNRQQSCYSCHGESRCVTCHSFGERGKFEHAARTGWYLRPGHASLACKECHLHPRTPERPDPQACKTCHAKRWGGTDFEHARTGVSLYGDHALFTCLDCHRGGDPSMLAVCSSCHVERPKAGERRVGGETGGERPDTPDQ